MPDLARETALRAQGYRHVAGTDEAGRGPLAGPVVAAAVILPPEWPPGTGPAECAVRLDDSKRLSATEREAAFVAVRQHALAWRVTVVPPEEIDRVNILQASLLGMTRAVQGLRLQADYVLVDGNRLPMLNQPAEALVKGDSRSLSIAAASILAKVVRDRLMAVYGARYPQWGFAQHKGYPTAAHQAALRAHGPSPIHRNSFTCKGVPWMAGQKNTAAPKPAPQQANAAPKARRSLGKRGNLTLPGI